jgi:hypothetical protein
MPMSDALDRLHRVEEMSPNVPVVFFRLINRFGQGQFWDNTAEQVQPVQRLQLASCAIQGQDRQKLIPQPFPGDSINQRGIMAEETSCLRFQMEPKVSGQPHCPEQTTRIILKYLRCHRSDATPGQVSAAVKRVNNQLLPVGREPMVAGQGQSVDGKVSSGQVILDTAVKAGQVDGPRMVGGVPAL